WRACGNEGDAHRGIVGALHGTRRRAGGSERCNGNAARRPRGRSGAGGAATLQSSNCALEIRRLGGLWHGARRDAGAFGGHESEKIGRRTLSGHANHSQRCLLSGVKRTLAGHVSMSAFDPKRTLPSAKLTTSTLPV